MRNYEIMFIVNPNVVEEEIDKINAQIESVVTTGGGTVATSRSLALTKAEGKTAGLPD